ncbi:MAG: hypothetical protein JWN23_407 [Rhodocyclales bacterium]|nr:hypothetical protein [Rhodocyclales bacterium]
MECPALWPGTVNIMLYEFLLANGVARGSFAAKHVIPKYRTHGVEAVLGTMGSRHATDLRLAVLLCGQATQ